MIRRHGTSRSANFANRQEAEKWARQMERQLDADKLVGKLDASHKVKKLTLHEAVERRIARKGQNQGTTARMRWWVGLLGENKRLVDVTRDDIERGIVQLQKQARHVGIRGQSPRIVDKAISASTKPPQCNLRAHSHSPKPSCTSTLIRVVRLFVNRYA